MALSSLAQSVLLHPLLNALLFFLGFGLVEEHTLPDSMEIGSSAIASWTIEKGKTEGFARLQINFPAGINIEPVETDGASFSFENGKAKFIWMDIPSSPSIQVKVKLLATDNFIGGEVQQRFSFIKEGSRQDVEFEPHIISLSSLPAATAAIDEPYDPQAIRVFKREASNAGQMNLDFSGFQPGSFLKLTEIIPNDCAIEWESNGNPSIQDRFGDTLLLVWQTAPSVPVLRLSYRLRGDLNHCASLVHGTWHTILNNTPHSVDIPPSEWDDGIAERKEEPAVAVSQQILSPQPQASSDQFSVPNPEDWLAFRVQLMACHRDVDQKWFEDNHLFNDQVDAERHEHWIKYTTGSHINYRQARNARVRIAQAHQFPGPFVTAYLRNERITVQEALLLSKQNWIP
jgi:hypothetical protein